MEWNRLSYNIHFEYVEWETKGLVGEMHKIEMVASLQLIYLWVDG